MGPRCCQAAKLLRLGNFPGHRLPAPASAPTPGRAPPGPAPAWASGSRPAAAGAAGAEGGDTGGRVVAQAYVNQRKLDHEVKTLQIQAAQFAKQTGQWINMVENFNQALKEIGDVENWARSIELDMRTIATALEYVYKGQLQPSGS
nr:biogenesis of lysosome-related organelles complex 1 subunit 1 isoform X1 [Chrysemys picta bellii]